MEKRSALQKAVLISAAAMAVAFAILTFVFHRLEGVKFEEGFLRVSAQADDPAATVYAGKVQGERVKITAPVPRPGAVGKEAPCRGLFSPFSILIPKRSVL